MKKPEQVSTAANRLLADALLVQLLTEHFERIALQAMQRSLLSTLPCPYCRTKCWKYGQRNGYDIYNQRISTLHLKTASSAAIAAPQIAASTAVNGNTPETALALHEGQKIEMTIACDNCSRQILINRYAPHLERCLAQYNPHGANAVVVVNNEFIRKYSHIVKSFV